METRVKENPKYKNALTSLMKGLTGTVHDLRFRAEYKHPNGLWYPCYNRRYNRTKRQAGKEARAYAAAHLGGLQKPMHTSLDITGWVGI